MNVWAIILVSAFFGISRLFAPGHDLSPWGAWEAFAHIWCGILVGFGCCYTAKPSEPTQTSLVRWTSWASFIVISFGIELPAFLVFKLHR